MATDTGAVSNIAVARWWDRFWPDVAVGVAVMVLVLAMQVRSGAYAGDLTFDPDEPAAAVSSLLVRDYVVQAFPANPVAFARTFYAHYPKVAIGRWPPLFFCGEGLWMLVAGRSRAAMLVFVALCAAALVFSVYLVVRRRSSVSVALLSVSVLIYPEAFRQMLSAVRPDLLLAVLIFWAAVECGEFMRSGSVRDRNIFLLLTVAALLVHGRAAVLLLLPFCLLPLRKRIVPWKWWTGGMLVALLLLAPHVIGQSDAISFGAALREARLYGVRLIFNVGWPGLLLALVGSIVAFRERSRRVLWVSMAALFVCGLALNVLVPIEFHDRLLLPTLPAIAVLAGVGVDVLVKRVRRGAGWAEQLVVAALAVVWIAVAVARVQAKPSLGYKKLVADCLLCGHEVSLIDGDGANEGGLIVEASLTDPSRKYTVLRGSKVLARSTWSGKNYRLLYGSPAEVLRYLDRAGVSLVLVQETYARPDVAQLEAALALGGPGWRREESGVAGVDVYRRISR
jgi:hypothetical protein